MFKSKKIKNKNNIGETLKNARYKTGLSLKIISKHIKVNAKYLESIEKGCWQKLPGKIYAKNFLKKYCDFLESKTSEKIKIDFNKINFSQNINNEFKKKTFKKDFLNLPKSIKIISLIIITVFAVFYVALQTNQITKAPEIVLIYPTQDLTTNNNSIIFVGKTEPEVKIKINNQEIILDKENNFKHKIDLLLGINLIKIEAKKKYSKTSIIERKIVFEK